MSDPEEKEIENLTANTDANFTIPEREEYREPKIRYIQKMSFWPEMSWNLFTEAPDDPNCILASRLISKTSLSMALDYGHLSSKAMQQNIDNVEAHKEINVLYKDGEDLMDVASHFIMSTRFDKASPILHTSWEIEGRSRPYPDGVSITYKIPKQYILDHENEIFATAGGESELGFFHGVPEDFVDSIRVYCEDCPNNTQSYSRAEITKLREERSTNPISYFQF